MTSASLLASPSGLGPYLNFGCLSPRLLYWKLDELYRQVSVNLISSLLSQQCWVKKLFVCQAHRRVKLTIRSKSSSHKLNEADLSCSGLGFYEMDQIFVALGCLCMSYNMVVLLSYLINMKTSWSNIMLFIVFCYPIWLIMVIYPTSDKWSWCSTAAISSWTAIIEGVLLPVSKSQQEIWPGGRK